MDLLYFILGLLAQFDRRPDPEPLRVRAPVPGRTLLLKSKKLPHTGAFTSAR
jgi:hypothetical protein